MSSSLENNIIYTEKNWGDVIEKYHLRNSMGVVIRENSSDDMNGNPNSNSPWPLRFLISSALIVALGNIPVQSYLPTNKQEAVFAIKPSSNSVIPLAEIQEKERTNTLAVSTPVTKTKQITTIQSLASSSHTKEDITFSSTVIAEDAIETIADNSSPKELELPTRALETYEGHAFEKNTSRWTTYHVKSYDNLTNIFHKLGHQNSLKDLSSNENIAKELKGLKQGSIIRATSNDSGELSELIFTHDKSNGYFVNLNEAGQYVGEWKQNQFEVRQSRASFTIRNGLFFDGRKAGVADPIIKQVVKVFDWDIDFSHDVRVDDKVTAVFEEVYHDGDKVGDQNLLATEFINKGHIFRAVRYAYKNGKNEYFTPEGREMKKAFIRTPIAHARVSSHFNPGRFHPKLHKIRAHKGTDFAARTGTPIMATGNGEIISLGRKGGYGRTITIKHRDGYTTLYAHMSRYKKGMHIGDKIYQGDTIGYVGQSGLATGPHLHYEFRRDGKAMDPMRASLPHSLVLSSSELQDFRNKAINLVLQLNVLHRFVKAKIEINSNIGG